MLTQAPKGTKDVLPSESYVWQMLESKMRDLAAKCGYREVRTPVFEHTELFLRGVGDTTDIVQKEMYTFTDKGERSLTLKPEGTAGTVRAFIENSLYAQSLPCKMYYLSAPIFRYEAPQSGRYREHHQFGMECFGAKEPSVEAELIYLILQLLGDLGLNNLSVSINSIGCKTCRKAYNEALNAFLQGYLPSMCPTCNQRFHKNPLRILDCKEEKCKEIVQTAPSILDHLCQECAEHFEKLKALLDAQSIPYQVNPRIVRGLDYYEKTVFEIIMQSGREGLALCGGGRYDGLVEELGGPKTPGVGFGIGLERIIMELKNSNLLPPPPALLEVYVANLGKDMFIPAFSFAQALRAQGMKADSDLVGRSLKAQFKYADKTNAKYVVIVGGDEYERGNVRIRNMQTKEELEIEHTQAPQQLLALLQEGREEQ